MSFVLCGMDKKWVSIIVKRRVEDEHPTGFVVKALKLFVETPHSDIWDS